MEGSGRARGSQLDVMEDSEVWFTLSTLLPTRIRGARRHLRHDTDPTLLKAFLQFSLEQSREAVAGATSANELAEAVAGTLDGLHSYLVAHDLVGEQYLADEQRLAELILAGESLEGGVASGERAAADPAAANRSDLALAA